jgi:hypothetical protein
MFTKFNARMYQARRGSKKRLTLTTDDLAQLYDVQPDTIRHWISSGKLRFTGNSTEDFKALSRHWSERQRA